MGHFLKLGSGRRPGVFSSVGVNDHHSTPNTKPLMILSSSTLHFSCILWATLVGRTSLHNPITLETTAPHRIAAVLLNLDREKKKKKEKEGIVLVSQSALAYGVYVFARHAHQERQSRSRWKQQRSRRNQCFLAPQQPPFHPGSMEYIQHLSVSKDPHYYGEQRANTHIVRTERTEEGYSIRTLPTTNR